MKKDNEFNSNVSSSHPDLKTIYENNYIGTFLNSENNFNYDEYRKFKKELENPLLKDKKEKYEYVNNPSHYMMYDMSVYEMMRKIWGDYEVMIWCKLTAWKYRQRMGTKPGEDVTRDLEKEKWYLEKYHELENKLGNGIESK